MKKTVMLLALIIFTTLVVGCESMKGDFLPANTNTPTNKNDSDNSFADDVSNSSITTSDTGAKGELYTLLLYDNMLGGLDDTVTRRASDRIMENERVDKVVDVQNKMETIFGNTFMLNYDETLRSKRWDNCRVDYVAIDELTDRFCMVSFDSVTGALMAYTDSRAGDDRGYLSEVNGKSGEAEFLAYAKRLVSQYSPVDGCETEITTEIFEYDASGGYYRSEKQVDGFVNNTEDDPDFYAIYHITFYRTIDGVRRFDTNVIEINSTGEVHRACFNMQDDLYAGFADEKIDLKQAEQLVKHALSQFIPTESTVDIVPSLVATNDGKLWLHLETFVGYDDGTSGYIYMIQISDTTKE